MTTGDIAFVAAGPLTATVSTGAVAVVLPTGWLADDHLYLAVVVNGVATPTVSAGWTLRGTSTVVGDTKTLRVYYRQAVAGDLDPTVTYSDANGWIGAITAHRAVKLVTPFAVAAATTANATFQTTFTPGSVVTDQDRAYVLSFVATNDDNALALSVGSENGFTVLLGGTAYDSTTPNTDLAIGVAGKAADASGTYTAPEWNQPTGGPDRWATVTDALAPRYAVAHVTPTFPIAEQFDGTLGIRQEGVRFDVLDQNMDYVGMLMVDRDEPPTITNDATRTIRRTVDRLRVLARPLHDPEPKHIYADDLDTLSMRVRPYWVLATDADPLAPGVGLPCGVFGWSDDSSTLWSYGEPRDGQLSDGCADLDQALDQTVGYSVGKNIGTALREQALAAGITDMAIETTTAKIAAPIAWVAGRDTRMTVLESLCGLAGFLPVYFDNDGVLVCRSAPTLSTATPTFTYGLAGGVAAPGAVFSNDGLAAPNRYQVVSGNADAEIVGIFDVPDIAPNSYARTGKRRVRTIPMQGLETEAQADAAAHAAYASDATSYAWLSFVTPPDPRHDTFDVVAWSDQNYLQLVWSLPCTHGGTMTHNARSAYAG